MSTTAPIETDKPLSLRELVGYAGEYLGKHDQRKMDAADARREQRKYLALIVGRYETDRREFGNYSIDDWLKKTFPSHALKYLNAEAKAGADAIERERNRVAKAVAANRSKTAVENPRVIMLATSMGIPEAKFVEKYSASKTALDKIENVARLGGAAATTYKPKGKAKVTVRAKDFKHPLPMPVAPAPAASPVASAAPTPTAVAPAAPAPTAAPTPPAGEAVSVMLTRIEQGKIDKETVLLILALSDDDMAALRKELAS